MKEFSGFSLDTFKFLQDLKANNTRDWFEGQRDRFVKVLQNPFQEFTLALFPTMFEIDPELENKPPKKMLSRIYRDVRFSKDKSPYRPNMWVNFHRHTKDWKEDPTFFFELMSDHYRYGMGFSRPNKTFMNALRERVEETPAVFLEMNKLLFPPSPFTLRGTEYVRRLIPTKTLKPELDAWFQKKGELYVMAEFPIDDLVISSKLVQKVCRDFKMLYPLYTFFWEIKENITQNENA
jgi:uncharacterized protein (TIGR02453 family)